MPRFWMLVSATFFSFSLIAENLRGNFRGQILPDDSAVTLKLEEILGIGLHTNSPFAKALEIEILIPQEVLPYRSYLAVFLYQNFLFDPSDINTKANRLSIEVLPPRGKFYLQIPLITKSGLKASPDTAIIKTGTTPQKAFPLALTILSIDKGVAPSTIQKALFQVKTRLINKNLGGIKLLTPNLTPEQRKSLKIHVNSAIQPTEEVLFFEPGLITIELNLLGFKPLTINAAITQAKIVEITSILEAENPQVVFEAPEGTTILLDGKKITWDLSTPLSIDKGLHEVQFIVGNYQVTDNFEIIHGGVHKVSLILKVQVKE